MAILDYVEYSLALLLANQRGRDAKLFSKNPAFANASSTAVTVTSPTCGPSGSILDPEYTQMGADLLPTLEWSTTLDGVKEWLVVVEDPDAPLPWPPIHGVFYGIEASRRKIENADIEGGGGGAAGNLLKGGFRHGGNIRGKKYSGARPILGHGPHRYFHTVVALSEPLDQSKLSQVPKGEELLAAIEGKVMGYGEYIASFERKWK